MCQISFGQRVIFSNPFGGQTSNGGISSYDFTTGKVTTAISLPGNPLGLVNGWRLYDSKGYYNGDDAGPRGFGFGDNHRKENGLYAASDGYIYGLDQFATGFYNNLVGAAILYRFKPENPQVEVLHSFTGLNQSNSELPVDAFKNTLSKPRFGMIEGAPGVLYGICIEGGNFGMGGIWKYDIAKSKFSMVGSFDPTTTGYLPNGPLFKAFNNQLYGSVSEKSGSFSDGHLYQVLTSTDGIQYANSLGITVSSFASILPTGPVAYDPANHTIYGARKLFANGSTNGGGMYSFNFDTKEVNNLNELISKTGELGSSLMGIIRARDGAYYGVTEYNGPSTKGALLRVKAPRTQSADFINVANFPESPSGNSLVAVDDKIFGTYLDYGSNNKGIWCYNISSGILSNLLPGGSALGYGVLPQLAVIGNTVYARTIFGGKNNSGSIVAINASSLTVTAVMDIFEPNGKSAIGELLDIGNNEYLGFSNTGGNLGDSYRNLSGNILKYNIAKKTVSAVASLPTMSKAEFDQVLPTSPDASSFENYPFTYKPFGMIKGTNGKVYFSLQSDEIPWLSNIFIQHRAYNRFCEFDPTTNTLKELTKIIFAGAHQPLEYTSGKFLMMGWDSLHVYDLASNSKKGVLQMPDDALVGDMQGKWIKASDGLIYGTTTVNKMFAGSKSIIYSLDPANNFKFTQVSVLTNANQANIGLTEFNGKLYGSTASGGTNNHGYIFSYQLSNGNYIQEYSFNSDIDGANFSAGWTINNGKLYSTSQAGGLNGYGTLAEFDPTTAKLKVLSDLTMQNGMGVYATPIFPVYPITADSSDVIVKDTAICNAGSASITASTNSVANPVFKWYSDAALTTLLYTGETFTTPHLTSTTKYYIAVSGTGVLQNPAGTGKTVTIAINQTPSPTPVISFDKQTICIGDTARLSSSNASGNQWYKDGTIINGATQAVLKVVGSGNYTAKTTNTASCVSATSNIVLVTVNAIPATPAISFNKQSICQGDSAILSTTSNNGFQWFQDGILVTGASSANFKAKTTGVYSVKTTSLSGCVSLISTAVTINVNAVPATPTITVNKQVFCSGDSAILSSSSATGNQWYQNAVLIAGASSANYAAKTSGNYTVKITNSSNCASSMSLATSITANATPATPTISSTKLSFCSGDSAILSSSAATNNQWYRDGGLITGATNTTLKVTVTGNYTVRTTSGASCVSAISAAAVITTNAIPVAPIVSSDKQSFCAGDLATLTSNSLTGNQWYKDGLLISGATASTYKATVSGNYTATASSSSSCTSALSNGISILSNPIPTTPIVVADGDTKICKDDIRNLSIVLPANTTSQWYKNGSVITGATNATIAVSEAGIYTNRLSAGLCVSALSNAVTIEVPCVAAIMMPDVFTPNGDGYNDKLYAIIPGIKLLRTFEIYNRLGNLVFSTADPSKAWDGTYKGSNQPSESYIWIIEGVDGSGRKIKKTGVITLIR